MRTLFTVVMLAIAPVVYAGIFGPSQASGASVYDPNCVPKSDCTYPTCDGRCHVPNNAGALCSACEGSSRVGSRNCEYAD